MRQTLPRAPSSSHRPSSRRPTPTPRELPLLSFIPSNRRTYRQRLVSRDAFVGFAFPRYGGVDSQEESADAGTVDLGEEGFGYRAGFVDVELEEQKRGDGGGGGGGDGG